MENEQRLITGRQWVISYRFLNYFSLLKNSRYGTNLRPVNKTKAIPPVNGAILPAGKLAFQPISRFCYKQPICLSSISLRAFPYMVSTASTRFFPAMHIFATIPYSAALWYGYPPICRLPFALVISLCKVFLLNPVRCTGWIKIPPAFCVFRGLWRARNGFPNAFGKKRLTNTISA